jgi:hypothetical protein
MTRLGWDWLNLVLNDSRVHFAGNLLLETEYLVSAVIP